MRRWIPAAVLAACAACGGKKSSEPAPGGGSTASTTAPAPNAPPAAATTQSAPAAPGTANAAQSKLTVKHAGATVTMTSAAAVRWGNDAVRILVANNPVPCAQALGGARIGTPRDDVSFYVTLTRGHSGDASLWNLTSYTFDDLDERGELATAQVTGDLDDGKTIDATFSYKDVSGTIEAIVCGSHPADDAGSGSGSSAPPPAHAL
jgi:hypothetical protein